MGRYSYHWSSTPRVPFSILYANLIVNDHWSSFVPHFTQSLLNFWPDLSCNNPSFWIVFHIDLVLLQVKFQTQIICFHPKSFVILSLQLEIA